MRPVHNDGKTIELTEYDRSEPLELSEDVLNTIDTRINETTTRLSYEYTDKGNVRLRTSSFVGLVSLQNGTQVRIRPKAAGGNFLRLLLYAHGATEAMTDSTVQALEGNLFVNTIGALYLDRLQQVVQRGLDKDYRTKQTREEYLRGRLDIHRQLSRGTMAATTFDIEYEDLTHDTIENQTLLYATHLLSRLVTDPTIKNTLRQREQQLRREITLRPIHPAELETLHLDRLTAYYDDILRLATVVIRSTFVDNMQAGTQETYGLLVNMNRIFERVVERAAEDALADTSWHVEAQARVVGLVTGGSPAVNMHPDFVLRDENGNIKLVGDAKWKTGRPSQSDIYQMTSYQLADDVPGVLLYPSQNGDTETEYRIDDRLSLHLRELPTGYNATDLESFSQKLSVSLKTEFFSLM